MGLFSGLKKALDKRKENRAKKKADKRTFKLDKIKTRQGAKTERVKLRQDAKVEKESLEQAANIEAYKMGVEPVENESLGGAALGMVGNIAGAVGSFFGGGTATKAAGDSGAGIFQLPSSYGESPGTDGGYYGGELGGVTVRDTRLQADNKKYLLWGGLALAAILVLPKMMNNGRRR